MVGTPEFMAPEVVNFDDIALETGYSINKSEFQKGNILSGIQI